MIEMLFMSFYFYLYRIPNIIDIKIGRMSKEKLTVIFVALVFAF